MDKSEMKTIENTLKATRKSVVAGKGQLNRINAQLEKELNIDLLKLNEYICIYS